MKKITIRIAIWRSTALLNTAVHAVHELMDPTADGCRILDLGSDNEGGTLVQRLSFNF